MYLKINKKKKSSGSWTCKSSSFKGAGQKWGLIYFSLGVPQVQQTTLVSYYNPPLAKEGVCIEKPIMLSHLEQRSSCHLNNNLVPTETEGEDGLYRTRAKSSIVQKSPQSPVLSLSPTGSTLERVQDWENIPCSFPTIPKTHKTEDSGDFSN